MALSSELISELVKVTNTRRTSENYDNTVYGTIVDDGGQQYAKIDGSDSLTPIATTVELNSGDRVVVTIKNHTATVMGNTTSPAINVMTAGNLRSEISQQADRITLAVEDIGKIQSELTLTAGEISSIVKRVGDAESNITQNADSISSVVKRVGDAESDIDTFTEFKQTVEGFSFMGGDVKISGGDLILDGCITWADLSSGVQTSIENATPRYQFSVDGVNDWHETMTSADKYRRDSTDGGNTWGEAYQFRGTDGRDGSSANIPSYIKSTYIDSVEIRSPRISANDFNVYPSDETDTSGSFNIYGMLDTEQWHFLSIAYNQEGIAMPYVRIYSPDDAYMVIAKNEKSVTYINGHVYFTSNSAVDFSDAVSIDWGSHAPTATFG